MKIIRIKNSRNWPKFKVKVYFYRHIEYHNYDLYQYIGFDMWCLFKFS